MTDNNNDKKQEFKEIGNESMKIESVNEQSKFENNNQKTETYKNILCQDTESITFDNFQKDSSIKGLLKSSNEYQSKTTNSLSYEDQLNVILKKSNLKSKTIKLNNVVQNILTSEFDHLKLSNNYQRNSNQNDVIPYNYNDRMIVRHLSRENDNSFCCSSSTRTVNSTSFCDDSNCSFSKQEILNCNFDNSIQSSRSSRISDMLQKLSKGISRSNRKNSESSEANNHDYVPGNNADFQEESSDKDENGDDDNEVDYLDENDEEILYKLSQLNPGLTTQIIKETIKTVEEIYQEVSGSVSEDPDEHEYHSNHHIRPLVEQKFSEIIEKAISNSIGHPSFENTVNIERQSLKSQTKTPSIKSHSHSSQSKKSSLKESNKKSPKASLQSPFHHSNFERNEVLPILNELDKLPFEVVEDYVSYKSATKGNSSASKKSSRRSENFHAENVPQQDIISEQMFENSFRSQPKYSEYHQELPQLNQSVNRHSNHSKCRRSIVESSCHHNDHLKPHNEHPEPPISPHLQCPCTTNVSININQEPVPRVSVSTPDTCLSNSPNQKPFICQTPPYSQCLNTHTQTQQSIPQINSPDIQTEPCISKPNIKQFCDQNDDDDNTEELLRICRKYLRRKNDTRPDSPRSLGYGPNEIPRINQVSNPKTDQKFQDSKPNIGTQTIKTDFKYCKTENPNYHYHPYAHPNSLISKIEKKRFLSRENCDEYPKQNYLQNSSKKSTKIDSNNFANINKNIPIIRSNFDMDYHNKCCGLYSQNNKVPATSLFNSRDNPTVSATCNRSTFSSNIRRTSPIIIIGNKKLDKLKQNSSEKSRDDSDGDNGNDTYDDNDYDNYDDDTNPHICNLCHKNDKIRKNNPNDKKDSNIDRTKENKKEQFHKTYQEECRDRIRKISENNIKLSSKLNEHKIPQNDFKMMNCKLPNSKSLSKNYGNEFSGIGSKLSGNFEYESLIKEEEKNENIAKINPKLFDKKIGDNITNICKNQRCNKIIAKKSLEKIIKPSGVYDKNISKSKCDIRNDKLKEHISKVIRKPQRKSSENGIENLRKLSNLNLGRKNTAINSKSYQHRHIGKVAPDNNVTSPSSGSSLKSESITTDYIKHEKKTQNFYKSSKNPSTCDKSLVTDETEKSKMAMKSTNTELNYFKTASSYSSSNYSIRQTPQEVASITQLPSLGGDRFYSINSSNDKVLNASDNKLSKMDLFQLLNNIYPTSLDPNWMNALFQKKFNENSTPYYLYNVKNDNPSNIHGPNGEIILFPYANSQASNRKEIDRGLTKHPSNTTNTTTNDNIVNYPSSQHNLHKPGLVPNKDKLITFSSSLYDDRKNAMLTRDNNQLVYNSKPLKNLSESQRVRLVNRTENNVSGVGGNSSTTKSGTPQYSYKFEEFRDPKTGTLETKEFSKLSQNDPLTNFSKTHDKSVKEVTYVNESYEPKEFVDPDELKDEFKDELSPLKSSSRSQSRRSRKNKKYSKKSQKTVDKTIITRNSERQLDTRNSEIKDANEKKLRDISMKLEIPIIINSSELEEGPNSRNIQTGCCEPESKLRYPPVRVIADCSDDNDFHKEYNNVICDMNDSDDDFDDDDKSGDDDDDDDSLMCTTGNDVINDLGYLSNPYIHQICHGTNCCPNHTIHTCFP